MRAQAVPQAAVSTCLPATACQALRVAAQTTGTWPAKCEDALKTLRAVAAQDGAPDRHNGPVLIDARVTADASPLAPAHLPDELLRPLIGR
ncbi:hypothetical protein ADK76_25905 [Streptomyces griseoflavus]|nr:hypothetical protein ADK76_25905 [Streptomyces griseoflavus]